MREGSDFHKLPQKNGETSTPLLSPNAVARRRQRWGNKARADFPAGLGDYTLVTLLALDILHHIADGLQLLRFFVRNLD